MGNALVLAGWLLAQLPKLPGQWLHNRRQRAYDRSHGCCCDQGQWYECPLHKKGFLQ